MVSLKHRLDALTALHGVPFFVEVTDKKEHLNNPNQWRDEMFQKAKSYGALHSAFETFQASNSLAFFAWDTPMKDPRRAK